jgi:hypothetical protein
MSEKILTLHPQGKKGVNISRAKYDMVRQAIMTALSTQGDMTFRELMRKLEQELADNFDGSVPWYVTTVKLDLEARGVIRRLPQQSPQRLQLV